MPVMGSVELCSEWLPSGIPFVQESLAEGSPVVVMCSLGGQGIRPERIIVDWRMIQLCKTCHEAE